MRKVYKIGCLVILIMAAMLAGCQSQSNPPQATEKPSEGKPYPLSEATEAPVESQAPDTAKPYPGADQAPTPVAAVSETDLLIASFRAAGASVELDGTISQSFFTPLGQIIRVNGQDVQVFVYADEATAQGEAAKVSADGSAVGSEQVAWVASPHFFHQGKLIVLYVGDEATVLQVLQSVLGEQFAGR